MLENKKNKIIFSQTIRTEIIPIIIAVKCSIKRSAIFLIITKRINKIFLKFHIKFCIITKLS